MTPFSIVAGLLLGLVSATAHQGAFAAESWRQARQPTWGDEPVYSDGYEMQRSEFDSGSHDPYEYRDDDLRRNDDRTWTGSGYAGYDIAPGAGSELDGFVDRDGRWVEGGREPAKRYRGDPSGPPVIGRYSDATSPSISTGTVSTEPWVDLDARTVQGGWRESSPGPSPWGEGAAPVSPQPEYRFRGDPQPWSGRWSGQGETPGYRFRPLTGQEAEQRAQTPGWRPLEPDRDDRGGRTRAPAGLMDALTPPPRTFGFEPAPWP
ncbi:hypothetical protein SAMN05421783_12155 [Thiocapsa roseopersicina]|uniref:Uncharacterized protein n=1 Tax=Thiocapsa roseopersicina TaxID=1058 RepID=A0A1H3AUX0_THIRO|nr:hypothetical protein SAMN05421783_12155 [Thiocapsa roseopersicina]